MTESAERPATAPAISSHVESPEPCRRVIRVEVPRAVYDGEYARLLEGARRKAVRPGFRPGKVPVAMVEKELRPELQAETLQELIDRAYREAVMANRLIPVADPGVSELSHAEPGQPVTFTISVEVRPQLTIGGYDGLPLRRRAARVADADVDGVIQRLREAHAVPERVDRAARAGDDLQLDVVPLDDAGQPEEARRVPDYLFTLGEKDNIAAFDEGLAGAVAGETREITVSYSAEHTNERLRGRTLRYRATVKEVRHKLLPEPDDAFAERVKPGATLLALRGEIRDDLRRQDEETVRREVEEQIVDGLLAANDIPVPPSVLARYLEAGLADLHARNEKQERPSSEEEDAAYRDHTRPLAERVIRTIFLLEDVRRQENIQVTAADVDARLAEVAREYGFDLDKYRAYAEQGEERERIGRALEERRTFDFLLSRAAVTEVAEPEGAA